MQDWENEFYLKEKQKYNGNSKVTLGKTALYLERERKKKTYDSNSGYEKKKEIST